MRGEKKCPPAYVDRDNITREIINKIIIAKIIIVLTKNLCKELL